MSNFSDEFFDRNGWERPADLLAHHEVQKVFRAVDGRVTLNIQPKSPQGSTPYARKAPDNSVFDCGRGCTLSLDDAERMVESFERGNNVYIRFDDFAEALKWLVNFHPRTP